MLKWYEHVMRREGHYVGKRAMVIKVQEAMKREIPKRIWLDEVTDDIKEKGLSADVKTREVHGFGWSICFIST